MWLGQELCEGNNREVGKPSWHQIMEFLQGLEGHSPGVTDSCGTPAHDVLSAKRVGSFTDSKLFSVLAQPLLGHKPKSHAHSVPEGS